MSIFLNMSKCGKIIVITGPMRSGKSDRIIEIITRYSIAKKSIIIFKPEQDTRDKKAIISRNGNTYCKNIYSISSSSDIKKFVNELIPYPNLVTIDECHFLDDNLWEVANFLANNGIDVVISGLDMSYLGKPYPVTSFCMGIADKVFKLKAICSKTLKNNATHTFFKSNESGEHIAGGDDLYEPRSRKSWMRSQKEKT